MKTFYLVISFFLVVFAASAQDKAPDEKTIVNKEYDENGNLIKYDSTYVHTWSSDSTFSFSNDDAEFFSGDFSEIEKMMSQMMNDSMFMNGGFSPFQSFVDPDSAFAKRFRYLDDSAFINHDVKFPNMEEIKKKMEEHMKQFDQFFTPDFEQNIPDEQSDKKSAKKGN